MWMPNVVEVSTNLPNVSAVRKWTLNRAAQATTTTELRSLVAMEKASEVYKAIRPTQIVKSKRNVSKVKKTISNEFNNPFSNDLQPRMLLKSEGAKDFKSFKESRLFQKENVVTK